MRRNRFRTNHSVVSIARNKHKHNVCFHLIIAESEKNWKTIPIFNERKRWQRLDRHGKKKYDEKGMRKTKTNKKNEQQLYKNRHGLIDKICYEMKDKKKRQTNGMRDWK